MKVLQATNELQV